jgi:hypothetical protein
VAEAVDVRCDQKTVCLERSFARAEGSEGRYAVDGKQATVWIGAPSSPSRRSMGYWASQLPGVLSLNP